MHPLCKILNTPVMLIYLVKQNDVTWVEKHQRFYSTFTNGFYFCHVFTFFNVFYFFLERFFTSMVYVGDTWTHRLNIKLRKNTSGMKSTYDVGIYSLTQFVSLHDRREHLNKKFSTSITIPSSCISRLLPPLRDSSITSRLRTPSLYPRPATRTKRYTSFIHHAVLNYQFNILSPSHPVT